MSIDELIDALKGHRARLGGDTKVVLQHRLSGVGSHGVVEYRHLAFIVPLYPDHTGKQAINLSADSVHPYRRFVDGKEVRS